MSGTASARTERTDEDWVYRIGWREVEQPGPDGGTEWVRVPLTLEDFIHPEIGDRFMLVEAHDEATIYLRDLLRRAVSGQPGTKVLHNCRTDFQVPGVRPVGPDILLLTDDPAPLSKWEPTYRVVDRGGKPKLAIEVTSPSTRRGDTVRKVVLYHRLRIPVYIIIDHDADETEWFLIGYRWTPEGYVRLEPDEQGRLWLEDVRLWLAAEGDTIRCYDEAGCPARSYVEAEDALEAERARTEELQGVAEESILARQEAEKKSRDAMDRAAAAEDRLRDMEAELARLRSGPPA